MRRTACCLAALVVVMLPTAAASAQAPALDVRVEQDLSPGVPPGDGFVNLLVTITDRGTGQAPAEEYDIYARAENTSGDETDWNPCGQIRNQDPQAPPGVYACTVVVDYGGVWNFVAAVNQRQVDDKPSVTLARGDIELEIARGVRGDAGPAGDDNGQVISGSTREVVFLWGHSVAAAAWFVGIAALGALALPVARRALSTRFLHRLEERLDVTVKATVGATALTVASGTYLLLNQTAYETPFSASAIDRAFDLPYAQPYFLALGLKLALYALMVLASVSIIRGARRQRRFAIANPGSRAESHPATPGGADSVWGAISPGDTPAPPGGTLLATRAEPATETAGVPPSQGRRAALGLRLASLVVVAGGLGIWLCVTLLKYFHELAEAVPN